MQKYLMNGANMNVELGQLDIKITNDIHAIQGDWERLEAEGMCTPFQTKAWLEPFYSILAPRLNATPVFVLVYNSLSHEPMLLLPLCARRRWGITFITFADLGVSDYNAPLISQIFNPTLVQWQQIWHLIVTSFNKGSILHLKKMPPSIGGCRNPLILHTKKIRLMDVASWGMTLPSTLAAYSKDILNPTFAKEIAKKMRRVTKRGARDYAVAQTPEEKRQLFDILARQRQARCDEMGRYNMLSQQAYRQFYEYVALESKYSLATLGALKVGGESVGTIFSLNHHNAVYVIMSTYEGGEWKSSSLGNVAMHSAIEHAIARGVSFFDLTIGNESYKQYFGGKPCPLYSLTQPLTWVGRCLTLFTAAYIWLKKGIKLTVPQTQDKK